MPAGDRLPDVEAREEQGRRLRARYGLSRGDGPADRITEWMTGIGAIPFALATVGLVVYVVIVLIGALR